jgi:DNA-directed RNA polymerase subunit K/omega
LETLAAEDYDATAEALTAVVDELNDDITDRFARSRNQSRTAEQLAEHDALLADWDIADSLGN